eukprot:TRINITY_DN534_c0_g1_i1.p1 TRINITY_DN534_c0_g1~~TRINITY_DN534_c0_g1_i1.p1  ORF type:complete len:225 (+),score=71.14 TRINITY_DN534_c0_g1_i1:85-675(+)
MGKKSKQRKEELFTSYDDDEDHQQQSVDHEEDSHVEEEPQDDDAQPPHDEDNEDDDENTAAYHQIKEEADEAEQPAAEEDSGEGDEEAETEEDGEDSGEGDEDAVKRVLDEVKSTKTVKSYCYTPPYDPHFPNQNQTKNCWSAYINYHQCAKLKSPGDDECGRFFKAYSSLCPSRWVAKWDEAKETQAFPSPYERD